MKKMAVTNTQRKYLGGGLLRHLCRCRNISGKELATRSGLDPIIIAGLESGKQLSLTHEDVFRIADGLSLEGDDRNYLLRSWRLPRAFKAYCVGLAKTGTVSMATIFNLHSSQHEFLNNATGEMLKKLHEGAVTKLQLREHIIKRDIDAYCAMDSSSINHFYMDILAEEFPHAKFIFTVRDCFSWVDSLLNYLLSSPRRNWFNPECHEWVNGLYSVQREGTEFKQAICKFVETALRYWGTENAKVFNQLPTGRSLVIKTNEISYKLKELASFVGVSLDSLNQQGAHSFKGEYSFDVVRSLGRDYLSAKFEKHCTDLMKELFPEWSLEEYLYQR